MTACFPTVAIVGSGPSGCYVAQFLQKKWAGAQITIFEALPVPYGLVRYGVAADHQGSKAVIQQFERMFENGGVEFRGNVSIGRDVSYAKLTESFDIVVLATGLSNDATLDIPMHPHAPVVGAGSVLKALNGHPRADLPKVADGSVKKLGKNVAVVGSGNVALDVMRLIAKSDVDLLGSDITDEVRLALATNEVESLTLISRSSASDAKCDLSMMGELLSLPGLEVRAEGIAEEENGQIAKLITGSYGSAKSYGDSRLFLNLMFNVVPSEIDEESGLAKLKAIKRHSDEVVEMTFDTVITAIGFKNQRSEHSINPPEEFEGEGIYRVGWLRRGPKGTVAENRKDAKSVADQIIASFEAGLVQARKLGLTSIAHELPVSAVDYSGWHRIDRHELSAALPGRCRKKITDIRKMLRVAHGSDGVDGAVLLKNVVDEFS